MNLSSSRLRGRKRPLSSLSTLITRLRLFGQHLLSPRRHRCSSSTVQYSLLHLWSLDFAFCTSSLSVRHIHTAAGTSTYSTTCQPHLSCTLTRSSVFTGPTRSHLGLPSTPLLPTAACSLARHPQVGTLSAAYLTSPPRLSTLLPRQSRSSNSPPPCLYNLSENQHGCSPSHTACAPYYSLAPATRNHDTSRRRVADPASSCRLASIHSLLAHCRSILPISGPTAAGTPRLERASGGRTIAFEVPQ